MEINAGHDPYPAFIIAYPSGELPTIFIFDQAADTERFA